MKCKTCNHEMVPGISTDWYCPKHDEHKTLEKISKSDGLPHEIRFGCLHGEVACFGDNWQYIPVEDLGDGYLRMLVGCKASGDWWTKTGPYAESFINKQTFFLLSETVPTSVRPLAESLGLKLWYDDDPAFNMTFDDLILFANQKRGKESSAESTDVEERQAFITKLEIALSILSNLESSAGAYSDYWNYCTEISNASGELRGVITALENEKSKE